MGGGVGWIGMVKWCCAPGMGTICPSSLRCVDRNGKQLQKEHRLLMVLASEASMAAQAELTRGVMTVHQTEQWHFLTLEPMKALRQPLVHFPDCTTASQCIGPIDMPNLEEGWQLTVEAKKRCMDSMV